MIDRIHRISHLLLLLLFFFLHYLQGTEARNSPPALTSSRDWHVTEDEPVGSVVTRLKGFDSEDDTLTFSLEPQPQRGSNIHIHQYFTIDEFKRVKIAKPLTGLADGGSKSYMLRVKVADGHISAITEVRLTVVKAGTEGQTRGGDRFGGGPGGDLGPGIPVAIGNPGDFYGGVGFPPPNFGGGGPPPHIELKPPPPLLSVVNRTWEVRSNAREGALVDTVEARDLSGDGFTIALKDPQGLLRIDPHSGRVTVAQDLSQKVGEYFLEVSAFNQYDTASEEVRLIVLPPVSTPTPLVKKPTENSSTKKKQQDLRVLDIITDSVSTSTESLLEEAPEPDLSLTIIPIVLIVGVSPLVVVAYCYWRRLQRRKARAEAKESSVVYTEKGEDAAATQIRPRISPRDPNESETRQRGLSLGLGLGLAALWRRRAESNKYEDSSKSGKKRKMSEVPTNTADVWEFPRHRLKILGILGEGCFGQVWKCEAVGMQGKQSMLVAVKTLKESAGDRERRDLLQELKVLKNLGKHINVVSLLGCCSEQDPLFVILEYMIGGKLQSYLRASRADTPYNNLHGASSTLTPRDLTLFMHQVARGMEFLARNGIIHRDLAARNVLVGEEKVCKVADFGFARDVANNRIYERKSDGRLPIRWMAPESLFDNIFTTKSDVWSYGVLLWEIVTLGSTPYPGLGAAEVMRKVREGYRLEKPDHCRREVYNIMYYCWDKDPKERPSFTELVHTLEGLLMSEVEYIELDRFPDHSYYNVITEKSDELL